MNPLNLGPEVHNPIDQVSGFAAIPRNMTGVAAKLSAAGYKARAKATPAFHQLTVDEASRWVHPCFCFCGSPTVRDA